MNDDELIARHIDMDSVGWGPDEARLRDYGIPIWALIGYMCAVDGDAAQVALDYDIPMEAMNAALAWNRRHHDVIAARILLNNAAFV